DPWTHASASAARLRARSSRHRVSQAHRLHDVSAPDRQRAVQRRFSGDVHQALQDDGAAREVRDARDGARLVKSRDDIIRDDVRDLERLGYAQQLYREMGGFSNFAVSFSIISILTGAVLLFGYGLKYAGPVVNSIGWPLVSVMTLAVAASMAEIASAYPTAGGLYFWAFRLGGRRWAWITAWLNMIGQVTITAGINVAAATYLIGAVTRLAGVPADVAVPLFGTATSWYFQLAVMVAVMVPQVLINVF